MAQALTEEGISPDLITGTSVGALNGSWFAGGGSADELAEIWVNLDRSDLFPLKPLLGLRAFFGRAHHFVPFDGVSDLLDRTLTFDRLEDAKTRFLVLATDAQTGHEVVILEGSAKQSILASAALPGVFPPIEIDGRTLIDGGIANNTPITTAIEAGATEVWVLSTGYSCALPSTPTKPLALAMHGVALLVQQRLLLETRTRVYPVTVHLIPPPCPITVNPTDFSQTVDLIDRSYRGTKQWLANGCPHALPLTAPHTHPT
jgi:NTE family protein